MKKITGKFLIPIRDQNTGLKWHYDADFELIIGDDEIIEDIGNFADIYYKILKEEHI